MSEDHSGPFSGASEGDVPVRSRGGFRRSELRTIPETAVSIKVDNLADLRKVDVVANYVPIIPMPSCVIERYRIDFEPAVESESRMRFLFRTAARELFRKPPIYDGVHECRSGQKLANKVTLASVVDPQDGHTYTVKFTNSGTSTYGSEFTRTYNMHMKDFLRALGFYSPQVGLFVNPDQYDQVGSDIMMLRGFRTAANIHDGRRMLMNLEASHKLVQKKSVLSIMESIKAEYRGDNLPAILSTTLVGKIVVTSYNKRCYRIEEIDIETKPTSTFERNGTPMSYVDYYRTVHNKQITNLSQPMLKVVPNNKRRREEESRVTLLVPELCNIAGLTEEQKNDDQLKMDLIRASQVHPNDRVKHLREFLQTFHGNADIKNQLTAWGYSYGREPCFLTAHVIPMTGYALGKTCRDPFTSYPKADAMANIDVTALAVGPDIKKMVIITARNQLRDKTALITALRGGFDKVKLRVGSIETKDIPEGDQASHYITAIRQIPADTTVAIVFMHSLHKERYDAIKKAASAEKGLVTQVVTAKLLLDQKRARTAAQKIAIQIAAKVGGEPWWVDVPIKKTMICGYDTHHDTTKRGRSFGAFVASLNMRFSRWWSKADAHERLEEVSSMMSVNIIEAVNAYKKFNDNELPERIIIYRDGVGEGQLEHVFKVELEKVREALSKLETKIRLTMIVVNKRIGARFYMRANDGFFTNPPPGTVIDHTVTREERFDFYLISQSTRQGTVTPTYYNIIHDEAGFGPGMHQKLASKLCMHRYIWAVRNETVIVDEVTLKRELTKLQVLIDRINSFSRKLMTIVDDIVLSSVKSVYRLWAGQTNATDYMVVQ